MRKLIFLLFPIILCTHKLSAQKLNTKNIVLITIDGFRWQELFNGADSSLMNQQQNFVDPNGIKNHFWKNDKTQRRKALLPFFWGTIGTQGQIYGNRDFENNVNLTNKHWFSYPGYNEILTGQADDERINSNAKIFNPNTTVLEFINNLSLFNDKVVVFSSWDCFPYIINAERSGIPVSAGLVLASSEKPSASEMLLNNLMISIPNPMNSIRLDAFTFYYGLEYMKKNKPRVIFFSFDETDDFAHNGEYGAYLNSAHYIDGFIKELWNYLQATQFYQGSTTLIIATDHGRGTSKQSWKDHGIATEGSDQVWLAFLGPDTPARGEIRTPGQLFQNQIARTLAAFLNVDFQGEGNPGAVIKMVFK